MSVIFKTFDVIEIDGTPAGNIVDVISNHGPRRAEVLAAYGVYVAGLQTEISAEKVQLQADKTQLTTDLATANASIATLTSQVASLESQLQEMTESKDVLFIRKQAVDHDLVEANAKIAFLESIRQFNPRWTTPDFFINRFTAKEAKAFYSSEDAMIVGGQQLLEAYEAAGWYVDLDDTQVQGLTGYMVQLGMLTPERREQVLRDATAAEAWYA
jgi:hypothetical protein